MNRTIKQLAATENRIYVYMATKEIAENFLRIAEEEGFKFGDGEKPTNRDCAEIMAVNADMTINYVGYIGAMAFQSGAKTIGEQRLVRVDFGKYIAGEPDYLYYKN